jgi:hypothetical protein
MHTNMRTVVVIELVEHDQDKETPIIIFEEDIHHEYPNESKSHRLPQSKAWTLFSGWGYGGKLVTLSGLLVVFYLNKLQVDIYQHAQR